MAKNTFVPPLDTLNNIQPKRNSKSFSDRLPASLFGQAKRLIRESYDVDMFAQVGALKGMVLEVQEGDPSSMAWQNSTLRYMKYQQQQFPKFAKVRVRIPELHAHLPEPTSGEDWKAINLHPWVILAGDKPIPEVGDIITVDYADKNNFKDGFVVDCFGSKESPSVGGSCSPSDVFNSGSPSLGIAQPAGDSIKQEDYSTDSKSSERGFEDGININQENSYGLPIGDTLLSNPDPCLRHVYSKRNEPASLFFITKKEIDKLPEFKNEKVAVEAMLERGVNMICFQVAENANLLADIKKMNTIFSALSRVGVSVFLYITAREENVFPCIVYMMDIVRQNKIHGVFLQGEGKYSESIAKNVNDILGDTTLSLGILNGIVITDATTYGTHVYNPGATNEWHPAGSIDIAYVARNAYDFNDTVDAGSDYLPTLEGIAAIISNNYPANITDNIQYSEEIDWEPLPAFFMGGKNFLPHDTGEDCDIGGRSQQRFHGDINQISTWNNFAFFNFSDMTRKKRHSIEEFGESFSSINVADSLPSNYENENTLNIPQSNFQTTIGNGEVVISAPPFQKQEPSFNSDDSSGGNSSQLPSETPSLPETPSSDGFQCTPMAGGATPAANLSPNAPGSAPDPAYAFSSIPGSENLGWLVAGGQLLNDAYVNFLNALSAAVYRRLPVTSPSFTGTSFKKLRVTSTFRTPEKQVWLMWDKMNQAGSSQPVAYIGSGGLYAECTWVTAVVEGWASNPPNKAAAEQAVRDRIAQGGHGHLYGDGVDISTKFHLQAEGFSDWGNASKERMLQSKFVQALLGALPEVPGYVSHAVESYQQHVHITFKKT